MDKISNKKIAIFFTVLLIVCGVIIFCVYNETQKKQFKTDLIAAACYSVKQNISDSSTAKFNNSTDSYVVSNLMNDGIYYISGYVTFLSKNGDYVKKPFTVNLKYEPELEKKYQIINVEVK